MVASSHAYASCGSKTGWPRECECKRERDPGKLGGNERAGIAAFAATWQYNPLLVEVTTGIGINPAALHRPAAPPIRPSLLTTNAGLGPSGIFPLRT